MGHFSREIFLTNRVPRHRRAVKPCEINNPFIGHAMTNSLYPNRQCQLFGPYWECALTSKPKKIEPVTYGGPKSHDWLPSIYLASRRKEEVDMDVTMLAKDLVVFLT